MCTFDGHVIFLGIGMLAAITPATRSKQIIPRLKDMKIIGLFQLNITRMTVKE